MLPLAAVALGGAIGAVARYQLTLWIHDRWPTAFPAGTFVVNMTGCLLLGLIAGATEVRVTIPPEVRLFASVGILGAFTTFSTFELEALLALERGDHGVAGSYIAASVLIGLAAMWFGVKLGRMA